MKTFVDWQLPVKTANEANSTEHWSKKWKRHKNQKQWIKIAFLKRRPKIELPCVIALTRIAPRELDLADNLPMSFKFIVDAIAEYIFPGKAPGRADDSKDITWKFYQQKGKVREYAIRIQIQKESDALYISE